MLLQYASLGLKSKDAATVGLIFMSADRSLKKRIVMLDANRHRSRWLQSMAALIVLAAAATGLTEARVIDVSERPETHLPVFSARQVNTPPKPADNGPRETVTFDVNNALASIRRLHPEADSEDEILAHFQMYVPDRSEIKDGKVTVEVTDKTRQAIQYLLKSVERGGLSQVIIECRLMSVADNVINKLGWLDDAILLELRNEGSHRNRFQSEHFLPTNAPFEPGFQVQQGMTKSCPVFDSTITDEQADQLVELAQADCRSNIMFAPKITMFSGQKASIQDLTRKPFVTNMRLAGDGGSEMEPVVEMVDEGTHIEWITDVTENMDVELQAIVNLSQIQKVELANLPFASKDNPKTNVTVQVPSVNRTLIRSSVRLSRGRSLLIAVPHVFSSDGDNKNSSPAATLIMLTPRIIPYETALPG